MAKNINTKDTVLSLNLDIQRQIKDNEEYSKSQDGKKRLEAIKEDIRDLRDDWSEDGIPEDEIDRIIKPYLNEVNMLEGKDYYFTVSDGFEEYTIDVSGLEKLGDEAAPYLLNRMMDNVDDDRDKMYADKNIFGDKRENILDGLRRLKKNIKRNIKMIRKGSDEYEIPDKSVARFLDKEYPIFQDVLGLTISINI